MGEAAERAGRTVPALAACVALLSVWVVLVRRVQVGRWTELSPADRNAAWTPPAVEPADEPAVVTRPQATLSPRAKTAWLALGAVGLIVAVAAIVVTTPHTLTATRAQAEAATRRAIAERGVELDQRWRVMPVPLDGSAGAHEFVAETAGEIRRQELIGKYLPAPGWSVRVATFQGDVADRAEEWGSIVAASGELRRLQHRVPEARPGASLSESEARAIAVRALSERRGLDVARGQAKEVSATPAKQKARTDWTFTFADTTIAPLPQGEPRIAVEIAGDEVASARPFVFVPDVITSLSHERVLVSEYVEGVGFDELLVLMNQLLHHLPVMPGDENRDEGNEQRRHGDREVEPVVTEPLMVDVRAFDIDVHRRIVHFRPALASARKARSTCHFLGAKSVRPHRPGGLRPCRHRSRRECRAGNAR